MRVGVTGGTGFVGRRLVAQAVASGDVVRVLTRSAATGRAVPAQVEVIEGDLCGPVAALQRFADGLDVLYHCAGETLDESRMEAVNLRGTLRLAEAARGRIGRWIQLSSVGAYGPVRAEVITEEAGLRPAGTYEVTKTDAERAILGVDPGAGFERLVLRPCKIIGVGMRDRSLYRMFDLLARGRFFFIGRAGALLNYVHVDDVARALLACGRGAAPGPRAYNLARQITVESFVAAACAAIGVRVPSIRLPEGAVRPIAALTAWIPGNPLTRGRVDGLTGRTIYSSERIERELGFRFEHSIESGLRELAEDRRRSDGESVTG